MSFTRILEEYRTKNKVLVLEKQIGEFPPYRVKTLRSRGFQTEENAREYFETQKRRRKEDIDE